MSATLQNLIDRTQAALDDTSALQWSEAQIGDWIEDGIRAYSVEIKREKTTTITTSADDRKYDLPADFVNIISVEYPTDDDPPQYLTRRAYNAANFWGNDGYYDIIHRADDSDVDEVWISEKPAANETITVHYHAHHDVDLATGDTVTVPDRHHHILVLHAIWSARKELQTEYEKATTKRSLLIGVTAESANIAYQNWRAAMDKAVAETSQTVIIDQWRADPNERIY